MFVKLKKSKLSGVAKLPPSKSESHRMLIAASLCKETSVIKNISTCDDVVATVNCLRALGADIQINRARTARVTGFNPYNCKYEGELFANESGSTLRFLIPLAYLVPNQITFTGSETLFSRPLSVYKDIADMNNAKFELGKNYLTLSGNLYPAKYTIPGDVSSQFISGLLFVLPLLPLDSFMVIKPPFQSKPYADMTMCMLKLFGVDIRYSRENLLFIASQQKYRPVNYRIDGDWSAGAFLYALKLLHPNIQLTGYDKTKCFQGDKICVDYLNMLKTNSVQPPVIDIADCPDLGPILFAMAAYYRGAKFTGVKRLRYKESDRIESMKMELEKFGAVIDADEDVVVVRNIPLHSPRQVLDGHGDHRIVMSLAVLATVLGGKIKGAEAVSKSFPDFFKVLKSLNAKMEIIDK